MLKIAIDIMGGDNSPIEPLNGIKSYLDESKDKDIFFYILGKEDKIKDSIKNKLPKKQYKIIHTSQEIRMDDKPSKILKTKTDSSMIKSMKLLKNGTVEALISAGNTGALMLGASIIIGKISGVRKVILAPSIPNKFGNFILADVGANINLKPQYFIDMAHLCTIYSKNIKKIDKPSIHLLNIGTEASKGTPNLIETFSLLSKKIANFKGNIESRSIMTTKLDVVLCDGFIGNTVLKLIEGLSHFLFDELVDSSNDLNLIKLRRMFNFELSTLLLGINGIVLKCHGSSKRNSFKNAIVEAKKLSTLNLIKKINDNFKKAAPLI